jgi:hypothetical protein
VLNRPTVDTIGGNSQAGLFWAGTLDIMAMTGSRRTANRSSRRTTASTNRRRSSPRSAAPTARSNRPQRAQTSRRTKARPTAAATVKQSIARINASLRPLYLGDNRLPSWLQRLLKVQQQVWLVTVILAVSTLVIYGWSVYSQQQWGMAYRDLDRLRRNERQLISGSEMMKNQIAEKLDASNLGLAPQVAKDVIFIQPAPAQPAADPAPKPEPPAPDNPTAPSGY